MPAPDKDLTLAFAGVFQAATLTHQLAAADDYDSVALHHSIYSALRYDAATAEEVFGSIHALRLGLEWVVRVFTARAEPAIREVFEYAAEIYRVSIKLRGDRETLAIVGQGVQELKPRLEHAGAYAKDDEVCEAIAALYERGISRIEPRIIVRGSEGRLTDPLTASRVRAALFAGIRAAWLWHQLGGRRWQVIFFRRAYQTQARNLLKRVLG